MAWVHDIDLINVLIEAKIHDTWVKNVADENVVTTTKPYITNAIVDGSSGAMSRIQTKLKDIDLDKYLFPH